VVLHNVYNTGGKLIFMKKMHNACTLFGLNFDSLLNGNASVADNRLFKVNVSDLGPDLQNILR